VIFQNYFPEKESESESESERNLVLLSDNENFNIEKKRLKNIYNSLEIIWPNLVNPNSKFNCQNISLNSTYDADGNMAPCCFIVPPNRNNGNLIIDIDPWNSSNLIKMRKAYKETSFENEKCSLCYFREGINNRYR
jgi:radical SAM protein with 4Fe4S-binding SPASM domain